MNAKIIEEQLALPTFEPIEQKNIKLAKSSVKSVSEIDFIIAFNLKRIRRNRKLSQTKVGLVLNVSTQQINKYENKKNKISASNLFKLANYYRVNIN